MAKVETVRARVEPILKEAIEKYCKENFIDESSAVRMALAQFQPIKKIVEELQTKVQTK